MLLYAFSPPVRCAPLSSIQPLQLPSPPRQFSRPSVHLLGRYRPLPPPRNRPAPHYPRRDWSRRELLKSQLSDRCCHFREHRRPPRLDDQNSGPLVQRRLSRLRSYLKRYSSPGSCAASLVTVGSCGFSSTCLALKFSFEVFHSRPLNFLFLFLSARCPPANAKCQAPALSPLAMLGDFLSTARQFGVGFHSNRPSIDSSVGSPPSLWGHSTSALSLRIPAKPNRPRLRSGTDIINYASTTF